MKKLFFYITAVMIVAAVAFTACKKEDLLAPPSKVSTEDYNVQKKIFIFMEKMEIAKAHDFRTPKGGEEEMLSAEEARWSMEATANYQYADMTGVYNTGRGLQCVENDPITLSISFDDKVSVSDAAAVYADLCTLIEASIAAHSTLQLFAVQISFTRDALTAQLLYAQAKYPETTASYFFDYDWWYTNHGLGLCSGPYKGQGIGRSGETELSTKLLARVPCYYTPNHYLTNVEYKYIQSLYFDLHSRECVAPNKYNLILNELDTLASYLERPTGKMYIWVDEVQFILFNPSDLNSDGRYKTWAMYGIFREKDYQMEYPYRDVQP